MFSIREFVVSPEFARMKKVTKVIAWTAIAAVPVTIIYTALHRDDFKQEIYHDPSSN